MVEYTKPIITKFKAGKNVPNSAISLFEYDNNLNNKNLGENSIANITVNDNNGLSQSYIVKQYVTKRGLPEKDNSVFDKSIEYLGSDMFKGTLDLTTIEWEEYIQEDESFKSVEVAKTYSSFNAIPLSIHKEIDGYEGKLTLESIKINDIKYNVKKFNTNVATMFCFEILKNSDAFNYGKNINGNKVLFSKYYEVYSAYKKDPTIKYSTIKSGKISGIFQPYISEGGRTYYFTNDYIDQVVETWVKHYGVCRYWGGGGRTSNNYYGDPDHRYRVHGWTAKGFFTDKYPTVTLHRWGHNVKRSGNHNPEKYPMDFSDGFWDHRVGEPGGIKWCYDVDEAMKYGGSSSRVDGGTMWASDYAKYSKGVFPPPGYENDYLGSGHLSLISGSSGTINHTRGICTKAGPQKTSLAGFYNYGGFYCKWYRDNILFYKGKTTKKIQEGVYKTAELIDNGSIIDKYSIMKGSYTKYVEEEEEFLNSFNIVATYSGILRKKEITYTGKACYIGEVFKRFFIDDKIPKIKDERRFIVNSSYYLMDKNNNSNISSSYIEITNISKEGTPLYYKYVCENPIYIPNLNFKSYDNITDLNYVTLIYDEYYIKDIVFLTKLEEVKKDFYKITLILNKEIGYKDNVRVEFISENSKIVEERVFTELLYDQGIDFTVSKQGFEYKARVIDYETSADHRRKIDYSYVVKTTDGEYTSNVRTARLINKKFALESELNNFIDEKMCISPMEEDYFLTAKEIIAMDCEVEMEKLYKKTFVVETVNCLYPADPYTQYDGNGYVYCATYEDTGEAEYIDGEILYTKIRKKFIVKESVNNIIYNSYYVRTLTTSAGITPPVEKRPLKAWYLNVNHYPFKLSGEENSTNVSSEAIYDIREYTNQSFSSLGFPYMHFTEEVEVNNLHEIKLTMNNVFFNKRFITVINKETNTTLTIVGFDGKSNTIYIKEPVPNTVIVRYQYKELGYIYKGFTSNGVSYHLDINPNKYHSFKDPRLGFEQPSYNLYNNSIYVFLRPAKVTILATGEVLYDNTYKNNLYHKINDPIPEEDYDLLIGTAYIAPSTSMQNTTVKQSFDVGGGIKDKYIEINKENLDGFFDINEYSEKVFKKNGTIVIEKGNALKEKASNENINKELEKHNALGILTIIK